MPVDFDTPGNESASKFFIPAPVDPAVKRPERPGRALRNVTALAVLALFFAVAGGKTNPGGPFISISCDVMPFAIAFFVTLRSLLFLRTRWFWLRLGSLVPIAIACLIIAVVVNNVLDFWFRLHSRGDFIGF